MIAAAITITIGSQNFSDETTLPNMTTLVDHSASLAASCITVDLINARHRGMVNKSPPKRAWERAVDSTIIVDLTPASYEVAHATVRAWLAAQRDTSDESLNQLIGSVILAMRLDEPLPR